MSEHAMANVGSVEQHEKQEPRERLGPVAGAIFGLYLVIITVGYFVGNMIYQIP